MRAFTLIELIIVVLLLTIIALVAIPHSKGVEKDRLRNAVRMIVADIEFAQSASIGRSGETCAVVFDDDGNGYFIERSSEPGIPIARPQTGKPYIVRFGSEYAVALKGVTLELHGIDEGKLAFTPFGVLGQGLHPTIVVRSGEAMQALEIDASTGDISLRP